MSAAYKNVLGGSLKLKGKSPAGAPLRRPDAPRTTAFATSSDAPSLSGSKRKAEVSTASALHAPPAKRAGHRVDESVASDAAAKIDKEIESEAGAGKPTADSEAPAVSDRRTAAQKAHDEALAKRKEELARKAVSKSHRQRVEELNQLLATTPEHYDLFKISYAGIG